MDILTKQELDNNSKVKIGINRIVENRDRLINAVIGGYETLLDSFWNTEVSPQDICDFYGKEAYQLFQEAKKVEEFIRTYKPDYELGVKIGNFEINEDGTVTILKSDDGKQD